LDGLLPGVLDRIPPCSLDPAVKEVDKVAVLAGATFASKVKYWRTQADQLSEVEKRYGEYIKDIPRRQEEMDVLFKVSQAEIADLDQRRARLETALMSAGLQPQNAQARLDRIQEIAQSQTEAMKAHRAALDQRLANLGSASEYIRQLRRVYQQYRDSAMIEQNLWREHYEALKDLRQMLWSRCRLLSAPEEGSRSCLGFIRIPGSDHGCRPDQKKDK
jgi:chromosome segregation ATPase